MKQKSSRAIAYSWPYPRHRHYVTALKQAARKWFAARDLTTSKRFGYILADREQWPDNIIVPEVAEYIRAVASERVSQNRGFPLHKYIHHGLSSQAMLFNLIGPLIVKNDFKPLQEACEAQSIVWPGGKINAYFEYEDRRVFNEDYGQPTSIDLVLRNEIGGPNLFIEAKFVEREFGGCSVFAGGDCDGRNPSQDLSFCYLHYIGRRYWELLDKHGFLAGPLGKEKSCLLSSHYQFFRELLFAIELGGSFVLLADERSPTFSIQAADGKRGLMPFLLSFVPESLKTRVGLLSIQHLVAEIKNSNRHDWIEKFEEKYGLSM